MWLLLGAGPEARAEDVRRLEAVGVVPLKPTQRGSVGALDEAIQAALREAVSRVARSFLMDVEPAGEDEVDLDEVLGKRMVPYTSRFRIVDDQGERPAMFAEDARMVFANADPLEGRDAIREALTGLLGSVDGIRHVLHTAWQVEDDLVAFECDVIYTRKDGKEVAVRGGCFFVFGEDGLCREQRITVDTSPVFA